MGGNHDARRERIELLEWDTDFFGFPIGRVDLQGATAADLRAVEEEGQRRGIACVYATLDPAEVEVSYLAQTFGYRLVEVGVEFERPAGALPPVPTTSVAREGTLDDVDRLGDVIDRLGHWSRYGADPRFGREAACRMFRAWLERAARDDHRVLLLAEDESGCTGLATANWGDPPYMDVVAVNRSGTGAAQAIMSRFVEWAGNGPTIAGWAAARNVAVIRFLEKCGFMGSQARYTFHRWFDEPIVLPGTVG